VLVAVLASAVLAGCASRTSQAPVADMSENTVQRSTTGTYVVRPGDTLYKIAQANNISVADLSRLNSITDPGQLRVGQVLRLNGSTPASPAAAASSGSSVTATPVKPAQTAEPTSVARASDASLISWSWPAKGKILQGFNSNTKGIDIAGKEGDPVFAAADGKVMYAGNGVRGLGNLVLLGHSNGFITAYAHNQSLLVKTGQQVKKGDKIAAVGQTDTTSPRLHFEIRRRGTPVNPVAYLPEQ
jgi:lipoprotein NlpD